MNDQPINVLCADDNRDLVEMLRVFIEAEPDMRCVGVLGSTDELAGEVGRTQADVLLMDLSMPGRCPMETIRELAASTPDCRVIVHSGYDDQAQVDQAITAGAWGFVSKHGEPQAIVAAIRRVHAGEMVIFNGITPAG